MCKLYFINFGVFICHLVHFIGKIVKPLWLKIMDLHQLTTKVILGILSLKKIRFDVARLGGKGGTALGTGRNIPPRNEPIYWNENDTLYKGLPEVMQCSLFPAVLDCLLTPCAMVGRGWGQFSKLD